MSRFVKLMSILAIVALIAVPAFAEVQNVKVSGDIDSKMINRNNYDFRKDPITGTGIGKDNDTWFMSAVRVQVDADLTDNVSTVVRLLNERDWGVEPTQGAGGSGDTEIVLDLASVKLKEMFYAPLTMTIGRQNLRFGSALVVGAPGTNDGVSGVSNAVSTVSTLTAKDLSVRRSFDAVRATFDYNPLVLDVLMSKINAGAIGTGNMRDDQDLYGVNAAYKFNKYNSEAEAYMFERNIRNGGATLGNLRTDSTYVWGVRGSLEPISKLVLDAELAMQKGELALTNTTHMDRSAWAADLGASFALDYKYSPKIAARYSYRSGQKTITGAAITESANNDTGSGVKYKAWDTMFEDQTHGIVANQIFSGNNDGVDSNGQTFNLMASMVPMQDLTLSADYYHFLLANAWNTDQHAGTNPLRTLGSGTTYAIRKNKNLGDELDLSLGYDYTEDVKLGLTAGFFLPGKTFLKDNNEMASTVMADVKVSF